MAIGGTVADDGNSPERLDRLDAQLRAARARRERPGRERSEGMGAGMRIAVELAAAVAVGTVIGIVLDRWLGTSPWLLIVFFVLGTVAGFLNVYRTAQQLDREARERRQAGRSRPE